jgi:serine/threonine protein phosphatase PrpC
MQDRADIFARGETAVLVVADGAGGVGDGAAAAELVLDRVREAVLDPAFDLLRESEWRRLLGQLDADVARVGESTAAIVALAVGIMVHASAGDSDAWLIGDAVTRLMRVTPRLGTRRARIESGTRGALTGRLIVASDGLFRHVAADAIVAAARTARMSALGDALIALATPLSDDIAILVAEP